LSGWDYLASLTDLFGESCPAMFLAGLPFSVYFVQVSLLAVRLTISADSLFFSVFSSFAKLFGESSLADFSADSFYVFVSFFSTHLVTRLAGVKLDVVGSAREIAVAEMKGDSGVGGGTECAVDLVR
jgi:hypothetical protein